MTGVIRTVAMAALVAGWPFHRQQPIRPDPPSPPSITQGARLYAKACLSCHGPRGDGEGLVLLPNDRLAPALDQLGRDWTVERLKSTIAGGNGFMPSWGGVFSRTELESLALYLRSLNPSEGNPSVPSLPGSMH